MNKNEVNYKVLVSCMTFNQSRYIVDAMNGFCMQKTDFPFICVIMDDASTDGEQEVIDAYLKENFDLLGTDETAYALIASGQHKTNRNCYFIVYYLKENHYSQKKDKKAYLKDIQSKIEYIALCEGDDYWTDSSKLQKQVDFLDKNIDCSCCVHDYDEYIQNEHQFRPHTIKCLLNFSADYKKINILEYIDSLTDYSNNSYVTKTLTSMYRRSAIDKSFYRNYAAKFDMVLFYALATQGLIGILNQHMGVYRINNTSVTAKRNGNESRFLYNAIEDIFDICRVDKTKYSKLFVYTYLKSYLLSLILYHKKTFMRNIRYLGFKYSSKIILCDVPTMYWTAILRKIFHKYNN